MAGVGLPRLQLGPDALRVRQYLYEFWCTCGHGPNLRDVHEHLGMAREDVVASYVELGRRGNLFDQRTRNWYLLKLPPFSSAPSQVQVWLDDRLHSYAGCAMEAVAISRMPPFHGRDVRLESYCACCLAPVTVVMNGADVVRHEPGTALVHVGKPPEEWGLPDAVAMCDSMNFVVDADHADAYEHHAGVRGVLFTLAQASDFVADVAEHRMWEIDWVPEAVSPSEVRDRMRGLGVDLTNWERAPAPRPG